MTMVSGDSAARARLATAQQALVRALVDGGPLPAGFNPDRVQATSAALARKRARAVATTWPALARTLGDGFTARFLAHAAGRPPPAGGALADGLAFARALEAQGWLPGDVRVERLLAQARLSNRPIRLAATMAASPCRLVMTVRAPLLGERWATLPLRRHN
jgi:hypothetical protein